MDNNETGITASLQQASGKNNSTVCFSCPYHCKELISLPKELFSMKWMVLNYPDFKDTRKTWIAQSFNCMYLCSCVPLSSPALPLAGLDWKRWEKIWNGRNLWRVFPIWCRTSATGTAGQHRAANTTWQRSVCATSVFQTWIFAGGMISDLHHYTTGYFILYHTVLGNLYLIISFSNSTKWEQHLPRVCLHSCCWAETGTAKWAAAHHCLQLVCHQPSSKFLHTGEKVMERSFKPQCGVSSYQKPAAGNGCLGLAGHGSRTELWDSLLASLCPAKLKWLPLSLSSQLTILRLQMLKKKQSCL